MTRRVRPVMSMRHSLPRRSRRTGSRGGDTAGREGAPAPACPGLLRTRKLASHGLLPADQLCLKAVQPTHTVSCFRPRYNCSPFYIYTYTKHAHIKQIVSSLHLFSIYSSRDHFIIHVKREPFFRQTPDPRCQSLGIGAAPWLLLGRSACSVIRTGTLAVFMWPLTPQPHHSS